MSEADTCIVAVDGGASRCRLVAFDRQGARTAAVEIDGHASLTLGVAEAWTHIRQGVSALALELGQSRGWFPDVLSMGLAGALQKQRRESFLECLPAHVRATVVTDGAAQLHGATGARAGICLAVGTGSVLHWMEEGGAAGMAGGWGFPAGDEASGAWLGFSLLQRYLWHRDGDRCPSPLMDVIERTIGPSVSEIQLWSTSSRSSEFARFAPAIVSAADAGDATALELLHAGASSLERLLSCAPDQLPICLVGGLSDAYRPRLSEAVRMRLRKPVGDVFDGLLALALIELSKGTAETLASGACPTDGINS